MKMCAVSVTPVLYVLFFYSIYMLMVFPITEFICFCFRVYTDVPPDLRYSYARWVYFGILVSFMPCYMLAMYLTWRRLRAKPLFVPKWKVSDELEEEDVMCTICYDLIVEPQTLRCQHSFCKKCISQCLRHTRKCPSCQQWVYLCSSNRQLKRKVLKWVKENGREQEYEEVVEIKKEMKIEKSPCLPIFCALFSPFLEPEQPPVRLRPIVRPAAPVRLEVVDEQQPIKA